MRHHVLLFVIHLTIAVCSTRQPGRLGGLQSLIPTVPGLVGSKKDGVQLLSLPTANANTISFTCQSHLVE